MLDRVRGFPGRVAAVGPGFAEAFLRNNKVLPPVLGFLALFVFTWMLSSALLNEPDEGRVSNQANLARQDPVAPESENRDVESYDAYQNKDPFRQLLTPSEDATGGTDGDGTTDGDGDETNGDGTTDGDGTTTGETTTGDPPASTPASAPPAGNPTARDSDGDGLTNRRETALGQDPRNPDTDGDGTPDGADDSDGDGVPDRRPAAGAGGNAGGAGGGSGGGAGAVGAGGGAGGAGSGAGAGGTGGAGGGSGGGGAGTGGVGRGDLAGEPVTVTEFDARSRPVAANVNVPDPVVDDGATITVRDGEGTRRTIVDGGGVEISGEPNAVVITGTDTGEPIRELDGLQDPITVLRSTGITSGSGGLPYSGGLPDSGGG